ncbi:hypothetical protein GGF37_001492 [Kickxella alabastrina]|nr:hypothetical protein GGF37_001492 [Kickxella alabastrina]
MGTWIVWQRGDPQLSGTDNSFKFSQGALDPGNHHYSFEVLLPTGLDGTVSTRVYGLKYELETRLEHSFVLKPVTTLLTPVEIVLFPRTLDLHNDDLISLKTKQYMGSSLDLSRPESVPLGQSICLRSDLIDHTESFVLHHLWDNCLSVRLRLPRGRVFHDGSQPLVDVEAMPFNKDYRFTKLTLSLEEITIVAKPVVSGVAENKSSTISALSQAFAEVDQSIDPTHNAWKYVQNCSLEYHNAITKVSELNRVEFTSNNFSAHGIIATKLLLKVPQMGTYSMHPNIYNSHIQVRHQIVYEIEYEKVHPEDVQGSTASSVSADTRIKTVASVYCALREANIVRREEHDGRNTFKGTLPVILVSRRIFDLWEICNLDQDTVSEPSTIAAAILDNAQVVGSSSSRMPTPNIMAHLQPGSAMSHTCLTSQLSNMSLQSAGSSAHSGNYIKKQQQQPLEQNNDADASHASSYSMPGTDHFLEPSWPTGNPNVDTSLYRHSSGTPIIPMVMPMAIPWVSNESTAYPPSISEPMGFSMVNLQPQQLPMYPFADPMVSPTLPLSPPLLSLPFDQQPWQTPVSPLPAVAFRWTAAPSNCAAPEYNPNFITDTDVLPNCPELPYCNDMMSIPVTVQDQIRIFQEQQRIQQEQFCQQLSEEYGQLIGGFQLPATTTGSISRVNPPVPESENNVAGQSNVPLLPITASVPMATARSNFEHVFSTSPLLETQHHRATQVSSNTLAGLIAVQPPTGMQTTTTTGNLSASSTLLLPSTTRVSSFTAVSTTAAFAAPVAMLVPVEVSAEVSAEAENVENVEAVLLPPPVYDDILPPEYEVPTQQPPPYRAIESRRSQRPRIRR